MISQLDIDAPALADAQAIGVAIQDSTGQVALLNEAGSRILEVAAADIVGHNLHEFLARSASPHRPPGCPVCAAIRGERFRGRFVSFGKTDGDSLTFS